MKKCLLAVAALALVSTGQAMAAGNISESGLAAIGLDGMQVMTDAQGEEIRGMGYRRAKASGWSYAVAGRRAESANDYSARGRRKATGYSVSGAIQGRGWRVGKWALAGGASGAYAK